MYQKDLWEKLGEMLAPLGRRCLISLAIAIFGGVFMGLDPTGIMGIVFCVGILMLVSILESSKTFFVANITVQAPAGEVVPCAIVKRNHHAYMPILPFFSLFFYVPYKTDYYLLKNVSAPSFRRGQKVQGTVLDVGLVRMEQITKAKAVALQKNPQIVAQELSGQAEQARCAFLEEAKPYFDAGLMEEIFPARHLSVCKLKGACILFHYAKLSDSYIGVRLKDEFVDKVKRAPSFLLEDYLTVDPEAMVNCLVILCDELLERLLRQEKQDCDPAPRGESKVDTAEAERIVSRINRNKTPLTRAVIEQTLNRSSATPPKTVGILLCIPALGALELGVAGLVLGMVPGGLIGLVVGIWLSYLAIKKLKQSSKNKRNPMFGQYRVVETVCIDVLENVHEDEDGTTTSYITKFANGESQTGDHPLGVKGDLFYLVYLPDSQKANAIFGGMDYMPSPDVLIEK